MFKPPAFLYEFGPFRLDATNRVLLRDERVIPLTPKVFETLLVLVEHGGEVLEKRTLMDTLWPETFVEESSLSQNIFLLRKALGEDPSGHKYIETVPKRGYRFAAPVRVVKPAEGELLIAERSETRIIIEEERETEGAEGAVNPAADAATVGAARPGLPARGARAASGRRRLALPLAVGAGAALLVAAAFGVRSYFGKRQPGVRAATAFRQFELSKITDQGRVGRFAVSPDGNYVAHVAEEGDLRSLWVRQIATASAIQITRPSRHWYQGLTFSPDGNYVYYSVLDSPQSAGALWRVPVIGGTPSKVLDGIGGGLTFAPGGKRFAFVRRLRARNETQLVVANTDGGGEQVLAARREPERFSPEGPAWSPGGEVIACAGNSPEAGPMGGQMSVALVRVDGGAVSQLPAANWNWIGQLAWLRDGSGIVLVSWDKEQPWQADQVWLVPYPGGEARKITQDLSGHGGLGMSADSRLLLSLKTDQVAAMWLVSQGAGGGARKLTQSSGHSSQNGEMDWTPDGRIVYTATAGGQQDIWVMDAEGKNQRRLTQDAARDTEPRVSPDGRHIVFVSDRANAPHIWRMDVDGANPRQLTDGGGEYAPSLTPDGRWVFYVDFRRGHTLWKVPFEGGEPVRVSDKAVYGPAVSPDGKTVACFYQPGPGTAPGLALISPDDGQPVKLFDARFPPPNPVIKWSPDGKMLTYALARDGVSNIWGEPVDGGAPVKLTEFDSDKIFRFAWSRDGRLLACERGLVLSDLVLIRDAAD